MAVKLTKNELKVQKDRLKQFQRYLPTLQLKKQQLQSVVMQVNAQLEQVERERRAAVDGLDDWVAVFAENDSFPVDKRLDTLVRPQHVECGEENIAGVTVPVFRELSFEDICYDVADYPLWVDTAAVRLREIARLDALEKTLRRQVELLEQELRSTAQRVNLFEKVKIPEAKENIRVIGIYLGDQQTSAVVRGKIAKKKAAGGEPMIEKMKVVHIVAAASEKTALLDRLRALGIVHFGEKASADQRHLERFAELSRMEMLLQEYTGQEPEKKLLSDKEFEVFYKDLAACIDRHKALQEQKTAVHAAAERLSEWGAFSPAELRSLKDQGLDIHIYRTDKKTAAALAADPDVRVIRLAPVGKMPTLASIGPLPASYPVTEFPIPEKGLEELNREWGGLRPGHPGLRGGAARRRPAPAQHPRPDAQDPERRGVFRRQQHVPEPGWPGVADGLYPGSGGGGLQKGRRPGALGLGHGGPRRR